MCYGGCNCRRCNPSDEPVQQRSAWSTERPATAGWWWWRRVGFKHSPIIIEITVHPDDEDWLCYLEGDSYEDMGALPDGEWQPVQPLVE